MRFLSARTGFYIFKRFQSSALQSRRIRSLHEKHGKLIAPDFHWCAKQARKVLWVAIGTNHTVMLMESGEVYTFGKNKHGELGFANTVTEIEVDDFSERGNEDMMVDGNDTKPTRRTKILKRTTFEYRTPRLLGFIREEGRRTIAVKALPRIQTVRIIFLDGVVSFLRRNTRPW